MGGPSMSSSDHEQDPFYSQGIDSDSDDAPEEVSLSSARKSAEKVFKQQVNAQISINTQRNEVKRKREEVQQARRKTVLPKDLLLSLAEKEKENDLNSDQENDSDSDEEDDFSSDEDSEEEEPPRKKSAIRLIDGIEVQADGEAYRNVIKNSGARDFLKNHFYGNRVRRQGYDKNVVRNGLFARNI